MGMKCPICGGDKNTKLENETTSSTSATANEKQSEERTKLGKVRRVE
jgi:hypothetical protein